MNIEKSKLKILIHNNLGADFEDQKESVERDLHNFAGQVAAFRQAEKMIAGLFEHYRKDLHEGTLEQEAFDHIDRAIKRSIGVCTNLGDKAHAMQLMKQGEANRLNTIIENLQKSITVERTKLEQVLEALDDDNLSDEEKREVVDGRPLQVVTGGASDAAEDINERRAEARQRKESAAQVEVSETTAAGSEQETAAGRRPKSRPKGSDTLKSRKAGGEAGTTTT